MAVTNITLALLRNLRVAVGGQADQAVRDITAAWVSAWDVLEPAWQAALQELVALIEELGGWPPPWRLSRLARLTEAMLATNIALRTLTGTTQTTAGAAAAEVVAVTAATEPLIMASQLPAAAATAAAEVYAAAVAPSALETVLARARAQITSTTRPLSDEAYEAMRRALIVGIAVGDHPDAIARDMLRRVEGAFNGGLGRAVNVARTECLDAYRDTSAAVHAANEDVLDGWVWVASLDLRACPSCWAMHGTVHPITQPGPWDHQQGRCVRLPKVKSWEDLGIPGVEAEDLTPNAPERFAALSPADRETVMGPGRAALLDDGRIGWADLAVRRDNPRWRPSYVPRTVRDLTALASRRRRDPPR